MGPLKNTPRMQKRKQLARKARNKTLTANAEISIDGRRIQLNLVVPADEVPAEVVLPILHRFSEQVVEGVEEKALETGESISCKKGCGACCRQPVPVTRAEARQLAALIEGMPEPQKTATKERFNTAMQKARDTSVAGSLVDLTSMDKEKKCTAAQAYFAQNIACPFLIDEACSIHLERPLICREYLVTSSPEHCENLDRTQIKRLPFPAPITRTFGRLECSTKGNDDRFILLIAALEWVSENPDKGAERPGPVWVQEFFQDLSQSKIPDPSPYF